MTHISELHVSVCECSRDNWEGSRRCIKGFFLTLAVHKYSKSKVKARVCVCLCYKMRTVQRAAPVQNFPVGVTELLGRRRRQTHSHRRATLPTLTCPCQHICLPLHTHTDRHTHAWLWSHPPARCAARCISGDTYTRAARRKGGFINSHAKPAHASSWSELGWKACSVHEWIK